MERVDEAGAPWGELVFAPRLLEAEVTPSLPAAWLGLVPAPPPTLSWHLPLALASQTPNPSAAGSALPPCHQSSPPPVPSSLPRASHFPCSGLFRHIL